MAHPADVEAAWDAVTLPAPADMPTVDDLVNAVHTAELSDGMAFVARVLEDAGFTVNVADGVVYADLVDTDPDTGIADCHLSTRTTRED